MATQSCITCTAMYLAWYKFKYISIGLHASIYGMVPIYAGVLGYVLLRETLKKAEILLTLISFVCVILVITFSTEPASVSKESISPLFYDIVVGIRVVAAFCTAVGQIYVRRLKGVHGTIINGFYGAFLSVVTTTVWFTYRYILDNRVNYNFDIEQIGLIFVIGTCTCIANQLIVIAITSDKVGRVSSLRFLNIVFGYIEDVTFFDY